MTPEATRRECRICGRNLTGFGADMRHEGEPRFTVVPDPNDLAAFNRALTLADSVIYGLPSYADRTEIARAIVEAIYADGLLRRKPRAR